MSGDHVVSLDFYSHLEVTITPHWSGIRGNLVESQDFYHHPVVMKPPAHGVSGSYMGNSRVTPLFLPDRVVSAEAQ